MGGTDDLLQSLPNGAGYAVIAERMQTALPVCDDAGAQHVSFDRVEFDDDDAEPWSNIGGPDPEPVAEVEPDDDAYVDAEGEAEVEVRPVPPTGNPWARRLGDQYDPLAGFWR